MRTMMRTHCPAAARAIMATAAVLVLGGCATKSDVRDLQEQLAALTASQESLIVEMRTATRLTQDTLRTQSGQMFDLRGDVTSLLRDIQRELSQLRALTGENQRGIASVRDQMANTRGGAGGGGVTGATGIPATPGGGEPVSESLAGVDQNANQLWSSATGQLSRGSLTTAQRAFQQFLRDYPNDARAPDAHFFLADILAQQDQPQEAMRAFAEIQELFPGSPRVADALYRIAILQIDAGNVDQARDTLQRIINTYPESAIALIARDKLEEIG